MPFAGPETDVAPPPLVAPPTGLLQAATVVEHPLLQTAGNPAFLVGPDAPDTVLASALLDVADMLFGGLQAPAIRQGVDVLASIEPDDAARVARVQTDLSPDELEALREATVKYLTAAATNGLDLGGTIGGDDPLAHWAAGLRWMPESILPGELTDPCNDSGYVFAQYGGRRVVTDAATTNADPTLTSLTAHFTAADVGKTVSGAGIPASTTILSVTNDRTAVMSANATATATGVTVLIAQAATGSTHTGNVAAQPFAFSERDSCSAWGWRAADYVGRATRGLVTRETVAVEKEFMHGRLMGAGRVANSAADGHLTNGSAAITSATADFTQDDVGKIVTSNIAGIPAGTRILSVTDNHTATLTANFGGTTSVVAVFTIAGLAGGSNRYLSDGNCVIYDTGSVDPTPVQGLAYANEVIARAGIGQGMIHVSAFFVEVAAAAGSPFKVDSRGRLVTMNGNIVVAGNGYDGVGPDGTGGTSDDAGHASGHTHEWIYVSDLPVIWRPPTPTIYPASMREALNTSTNEVTFRAMREYVIEWSALLQVAIKVNVLGT